MRLAATIRSAKLLLVLLAIGSPNAVAQTGSPEASANRFLDAIADARWTEAAGLLDLTAFKEYVDEFLARTGRSASGRPLPSVADLRRQDPSMPREVAEWQVQQMRQAQERYADPTPFEFARVRSAAVLRQLDLSEAAARWLEARDPRYSIPRQLEAMSCPVPAASDFPTPRRRVLGTVPDGNTLVYALYREEIEYGGPPAGGDLGILELRLKAGRWLIQPRGDLLPELSLGMDGEGCPGER